VQFEGQKRIIIVAKKEIPFGEELTYDYKLPFEDTKIKCECGASACSGFMN